VGDIFANRADLVPFAVLTDNQKTLIDNDRRVLYHQDVDVEGEKVTFVQLDEEGDYIEILDELTADYLIRDEEETDIETGQRGGSRFLLDFSKSNSFILSRADLVASPFFAQIVFTIEKMSGGKVFVN